MELENSEDLLIATIKEDDLPPEEPSIKIWIDGVDEYSFASKFDPVIPARILSGLMSHILEQEIVKR